MRRPSVYPYTNKMPPGVNVHNLRETKKWTLRELAKKCQPPLDHTTIRRLEYNEGYTQDSLERVASALGVTVVDLFSQKLKHGS